MTMQIILPWPDKRLSPNSRCHYMAKAKAVKLARCFAHWKVLEQTAAKGTPGMSVAYTFHPGTKRRRDLDNLIASTKASTDGIAQALGVDDSTFKLSYAMGDVRKPACVVVTVSHG
jgi:crossover junction endodeoxyribonuclease RusA